MFILLCVLLLLCELCYRVVQMRSLRSGREPPCYKGYRPLIGHSYVLIGDSKDMWNFLETSTKHCLKSREDVVYFVIGHQIYYNVLDAEDALTVSNACFQKHIIYEFGKVWVGEGLVSATESIWKRHRKLLNPAFNQQVLDSFLDVFNNQSRKLITKLAVENGHKPFDHLRYLTESAFESIFLTAFGLNADNDILTQKKLYFESVQELLSIIIGRFKKFWLHSDLIYSLTNIKKKQDQLIKVMNDVAYKVIDKKKAELQENSNDTDRHKAFLDLLLDLGTQGKLTDQEIREEVDTMIETGHDTIAITLTYVLVMIGSHPEVQERIYKELEEVFGDSDKDVEKQDLSKLVYLEAAIKESMRLYPVLPVVARYLDKDVKLKNYTLSSGNYCVISIYGINTHPKWGEDAFEYRPERWLDPTKTASFANTFASFSFGRRNCIGKLFAMLSMKTTLAHLLRHYKIYADHTKMQLKFDILMRPVSGHHIAIERRN